MIRRGVFLLLAVLALTGLAQWVSQAEGYVIIGSEEQPSQPARYTREQVLQFMRNTAAPSFTLPSTDGASVSLADFQGDIVLLSFWVSWDEDCLENMALLSQVEALSPDVTVILINDLPVESQAARWSDQAQAEHVNWINGYLSENDYDLRVLIDAAGEVFANNIYQGTNLPVTCFIDRQGVLRIPWQGRLSEQTLDTLLAMMRSLDL